MIEDDADLADWKQESSGVQVKTKVNGPFGPTWIVLNEFSRSKDLVAVFEQKIDEYLAATGKSKTSIEEIVKDPDADPAILTLLLWISDKQEEFESFDNYDKAIWLNENTDAYCDCSQSFAGI